jgi:hypothetical protein
MMHCPECNKTFTPVDGSLPPDPKDPTPQSQNPTINMLTTLPNYVKIFDRSGTEIASAPIIQMDTQLDLGGLMRVRMELEVVMR